MKKLLYRPKNNLEKFGIKVFFVLGENSPQTFFVGGMVRDLLLKLAITDIDIATALTPTEVEQTLADNNIEFSDANKNFGVITALRKNLKIEIATFRTETYRVNRYPKVSFISKPKPDSNRRDFSLNALYFQPNTGIISDFHNGLGDIQKRRIEFIGDPTRRILEDPLRIVRALRFSLILNFKIEKESLDAIKNNFFHLQKISKNKIETEIKKIKSKKFKSTLEKVINSPQTLDKYFK